MTQNASRILFVGFLGHRAANGGINSLFELASNLDIERVGFVSQKDDPCLERWRKKNIDVKVIPSNSGGNTLSKLMDIRRWRKEFQKLINEFQPHQLICNDIRALMYAAPIAKKQNIPVAFFVRDVFEPQRKYGLKWRYAIQNADRILCLSKDMAQELRRRLVPLFGAAIPTEHIYSVVNFQKMMSVEPAERQRIREKFGIPVDKTVIVYVAGVCDKKNQLQLLQSLPGSLSNLPNLHIHFVGDFDIQHDPYSKQCYKVVQEKGLERLVTFQGYSGGVENWYQIADCTLLASRREGLARCMIESLACGVPVVSFDVSSAHEILQDFECGFVVKQGNYPELFERLVQIVTNENLKRQFGENGFRLSRDLFSAQKNCERFLNIVSGAAT